MATEYAISFRDHRLLATVAAMQVLIKTHVPSLRFHWTTSCLEKLRIARERGIEFPPAVREGMEALPSLLNGVAEAPG